MKAFIVAIASFVALLVVVSAGASTYTAMRCIPGQSYSINCNRCECTKWGFPLLCTKKSCPDHEPCIHGKIKKSGNCDICICNGGSWFCYSSECKGKETTENNDDRIKEYLHNAWGNVHLVGSK